MMRDFFVERAESRLGTAIHMFFVFFPIGVLWLDAEGVVVDSVIARPFPTVLRSRAAAKYSVEGPPALVTWVQPGERLRMEPLDGPASSA